MATPATPATPATLVSGGTGHHNDDADASSSNSLEPTDTPLVQGSDRHLDEPQRGHDASHASGTPTSPTQGTTECSPVPRSTASVSGSGGEVDGAADAKGVPDTPGGDSWDDATDVQVAVARVESLDDVLPPQNRNSVRTRRPDAGSGSGESKAPTHSRKGSASSLGSRSRAGSLQGATMTPSDMARVRRQSVVALNCKADPHIRLETITRCGTRAVLFIIYGTCLLAALITGTMRCGGGNMPDA